MSSFVDYGLLAIAFLINLILLVMICFRTPKIMMSYKAVLLCGWYSDFIFNLGAFIGRPVSRFKFKKFFKTFDNL